MQGEERKRKGEREKERQGEKKRIKKRREIYMQIDRERKKLSKFDNMQTFAQQPCSEKAVLESPLDD